MVAKLPFEPFSLLAKITRRGIEDTKDLTSCAWVRTRYLFLATFLTKRRFVLVTSYTPAEGSFGVVAEAGRTRAGSGRLCIAARSSMLYGGAGNHTEAVRERQFAAGECHQLGRCR